MKRILGLYAAVAVAILAAAHVGSQTLDDARVAHNATTCEALALDAKCTDAAAAAAWAAANGAATRPVERQVFSTVASYRDTVILPPMLKARVAARRASFADKVANLINTDDAKCLEIATLLGADAGICK